MKTTCISNFNSFPTCTSSGLPWCPVAGEVEPSLSTRLVPHPKYSLGGKKTEHPRISWNFHLPFLHQETCLNSANLGRCYISPSPALSTCNCRAKATPAKDFQMIFDCDWKPRIFPDCCCCTAAHPLAVRTSLEDAGITPISQATSPTVRSTL